MEARNVPGKILTTDYLMFSDPAALDTLAGLKNLEVRMFRTNNVGFHTKGYLFHTGNDIRIIVGSSNLTQNAITRNFEWNTKVIATSDGQYAKDIENEFNNVWQSSVDYNEYKEEYSRQFKDAKARKAELDKIVSTLDLSYSRVIEPNQMQREFMSDVMRLIRSANAGRFLFPRPEQERRTLLHSLSVRCCLAMCCKRRRYFSCRIVR